MEISLKELAQTEWAKWPHSPLHHWTWDWTVQLGEFGVNLIVFSICQFGRQHPERAADVNFVGEVDILLVVPTGV